MALRRLFNSIRWLALAIAVGLLAAALRTGTPGGRLALAGSSGLLLAFAGLLIGWSLRPNRSRVDRTLVLEDWDVVADTLHNSNTDLIWWAGKFYLVHAVSPYHFASAGTQLRLQISDDGRRWTRLASIALPGEDIRDPKLAVIGDRFILYALANRSFDPEPYTTVCSVSEDNGRTWTALRPMGPAGWLFWKPKTVDGQRWYAAAYWHEHGRSALFTSRDGLDWQQVATIFDGGRRNDETDLGFLPDGRMLATLRLEGDFREWGYGMLFGHRGGGTLVVTADPPYTEFRIASESGLTRLDGPALFSHDGRVFAVGRLQPELGGPFTRQGSVFARKRTSLFEVTSRGLTWLSDLPSAGDTSYAGVAVCAAEAYISYYTSPIDRDVPWIVGMFNATRIRLARVSLAGLSLAAAASSPPARRRPSASNGPRPETATKQPGGPPHPFRNPESPDGDVTTPTP